MNLINSTLSNQPATTQISSYDELESTRLKALLLTEAGQIPFASTSELVGIQAVLQHGTCFGRWQTPRRWFTTAVPAKLDIDLRSRILRQLPNESVRNAVLQPENLHILNQAVLTLVRYLVVLRMGPAAIGMKRDGASLDPRSVAEIAYFVAPSLFGIAIAMWLQSEKQLKKSASFLEIVKHEDLGCLNSSIKRLVLTEIRRMMVLEHRGCWKDLPNIITNIQQTTPVSGDAIEPSSQSIREPHLPLPDEYVSTMGQRSIWLIESLAPNLFLLAQEINSIWASTESEKKPSAVEQARRQKIVKLFEGWDWRDANGLPISKPPFDIHLSKHGQKGKKLLSCVSWPPRQFAEFLGLLSNVQLAHLFIVCMSTGARKSETINLQRDCLVLARDGLSYASGRTFKLVQRHDGELRDWVLPDLAVKAIEQQCRLVQLIESIEPQRPSSSRSPRIANPVHLWAQISKSGNHSRGLPLLHLDRALRGYARALGMDERPSGQWIRPHRLRKTVARLTALALTQAPKVLMSVFGHKTIEMTLHYILTDKTLHAEIEQVGRELRILRAVETVESLVEAEDSTDTSVNFGGFGGPAALMVHSAVQLHRERVHQRGEQWAARSVRELAEILTLQGKSWEVVRQGVICTKFPGSESGPCNKSKGRPEPSRCQTNCSHRLEERFLRDDIDAALASCIHEYEAALKSNDELMQAMWAGQIRAHIGRFEDIREKWMRNPQVQRLIAASKEFDSTEAE